MKNKYLLFGLTMVFLHLMKLLNDAIGKDVNEKFNEAISKRK